MVTVPKTGLVNVYIFDIIQADATSHNWHSYPTAHVFSYYHFCIKNKCIPQKLSIQFTEAVFPIYCYKACCHLPLCWLSICTFCLVLERPGSTSQGASNQQPGAKRDDGILLQETGRTESKLWHNIITALLNSSHISKIYKAKILCKCHAVPKYVSQQ